MSLKIVIVGIFINMQKTLITTMLQ